MTQARDRLLSGWMDRSELARELDVSPATLARWASEGSGPPHVKVGRRVFYRRAAVEKWLVERERRIGNG